MTVACVLVAIQIEAAPGKDKGKGGKSGEENSTTTQRSSEIFKKKTLVTVF